MERRWGERLIVNQMVRVVTSDGTSSVAWLHDVSLNGGFLSTRLHMPWMARVHLDIRIPGEGGDSLHEVEAFVVRDTSRGTALEWSEFAPETIVGFVRVLNDTGHVMARMQEPELHSRRAR